MPTVQGIDGSTKMYYFVRRSLFAAVTDSAKITVTHCLQEAINVPKKFYKCRSFQLHNCDETTSQDACYIIDGSSVNRVYPRIQYAGKHTELVYLNAPKLRALHDSGQAQIWNYYHCTF